MSIGEDGVIGRERKEKVASRTGLFAASIRISVNTHRSVIAERGHNQIVASECRVGGGEQPEEGRREEEAGSACH